MSVGQRELTFRPGLGRPSGAGWRASQEARLRVWRACWALPYYTQGGNKLEIKRVPVFACTQPRALPPFFHGQPWLQETHPTRSPLVWAPEQTRGARETPFITNSPSAREANRDGQSPDLPMHMSTFLSVRGSETPPIPGSRGGGLP